MFLGFGIIRVSSNFGWCKFGFGVAYGCRFGRCGLVVDVGGVGMIGFLVFGC